MEHKIKLSSEGEAYANLELTTHGNSKVALIVESKDKDNDVELNIEEGHNIISMYLNQDQLKALIHHLQTQIIQE